MIIFHGRRRARACKTTHDLPSGSVLLRSGFMSLVKMILKCTEIHTQTLTNKGLSVGGEACKGRFGAYFMWPEDFKMETILS